MKTKNICSLLKIEKANLMETNNWKHTIMYIVRYTTSQSTHKTHQQLSYA